MSNKFLQLASTKAQQNLDAVTKLLLGHQSIRTMQYSVDAETAENEFILNEIATAISVQVAVEAGVLVLSKAYAQPVTKVIERADKYASPDVTSFVTELVRQTTREHHDQTDRIVIVSGRTYEDLQRAGVLTVLGDGEGAEIDEDEAFLRSKATLNGAAVLINSYITDPNVTLVLKDGWFDYAGSGVSVSGTDNDGKFLLDRVTEINPDKIVVIQH